MKCSTSIINYVNSRFFLNSKVTTDTIIIDNLFIFYKSLTSFSSFFTYKNLLELNILFMYFKNNYRSIRLFFGYSYTNRTHTNNNSSKKHLFYYRNIIIKYIYKNLLVNEKETDKLLFTYIEFFNKLWFFFWFNEWISAFRNLTKALSIRFSKWKFSYTFLTHQRPIVFFKKKSNKKKSNKKKSIQLKNTYNIGFYLGFSVKYKEVIKRFNTLSK